MFRIIFILATVLAVTACAQKAETSVNAIYPTVGNIERLSPKLDDLVKPGAKIEILAEGFEWSEGPVWVPGHEMLLFSDVPANRIYRWREGEHSAEVYLQPSGDTGFATGGHEGSNGLLLDPQGRLVMCQHADRRIARMDTSLDKPQPAFATLVDNYQGKRFNSPNDAVYDRQGNLYFTDPPYGLADESARELPFQGTYKLSAAGELTLLTDELSRPNGIALSPDEKTLYVANSDPEHAIWMAYDVNADGTIGNGRIFYDATDYVARAPGLPDGLKIDDQGNLYATGPGGVWIFSPDGEHLGTIKTGQATANNAFNQDKSVMYITADMYLLRVVLK